MCVCVCVGGGGGGGDFDEIFWIYQISYKEQLAKRNFKQPQVDYFTRLN